MCGVSNKEFYTVERLILEKQSLGEVLTLHGLTNKVKNGSLHLDFLDDILGGTFLFGTREL